MEPDTPPSVSSVRATKRKLEAAIRSLDGAVVSPSSATTVDRPTPSKRPHIARSVYSTLAKLSRASKERSRLSSKSVSQRNKAVAPLKEPTSSNSALPIDVSKSVPRLAAILARSTPQPKQALPFSHPSVSPVHLASEYRPSSTDSFLSRLATYKITTYASKPPQIDAVAAARCGWINDGKDRLVCGMCDVSWVLAGREGMSKDAASALVEKQRVSLVEMHKGGCPWKTRQCEPSVYRVPLQAPTAMVREVRTKALSLEPILANVAIKHPLAPSQLSSLHSIFSVASSEGRLSERGSITDVDETARPAIPSDAAIAVALFGWIPAPTTLHRTSSLYSRARPFDSSTLMPLASSLSCTSSISSRLRERASTPTPSASARTSISQFSTSPDRASVSSHTKSPWSDNVAATTVSRDASLVYCVLCQRRVGLWGYPMSKATTSLVKDMHSASSRGHQKEFDLVKEHRSYCPYVVCSSVVPSFSHSPVVHLPGNSIEGWRAVLTVVQRYELSQRQRLSRFLASDNPDAQASSEELKGVEAMVAGVKINGGRELLRYVKTVLG